MFSRSEVLGGMPARRASGILFAIEATTARLMAGSRVSRATFTTSRGSAQREEAFLEAIAAGRDLPVQPTIQDLERFAPQWAHLVPDGIDARAALAVLIGAKYRFTRELVPGLRDALGIDDPAVAAAIGLQRTERASIYVASLSFRERLAWARAGLAHRIERMPPFWVAYALALTETITEGILVVPIAVAGIGPLAGIVVLVVLGLFNLITLGALVEAITRNGSMRYGAAYFGRLVGELLGRAGAMTLTVALGIFNAVVLLVYLLGFASVLWGATGIPQEIWVLLLVAANLWVLRREALDETVATAVIVGVVNVTLILVITGIAFLNMQPGNLGYRNVPFLDGGGLDPLVLQLVFGVIIVSFFGHTSAANASKLILGRDPTGRALLWGNLAALASVIALYCLIVIGFSGALGPDLAVTRGTALTPLADVAGPIVSVLGSIYVVLAVGLGSLYCSLGLYNQVVEHLPSRTHGAGFLATRPGRYLAGIAPTLATFIVLEYLIVSGQDSFAGPVALIGVLTVPMLGGVFPMLLVLAARRRGEYLPGRVIGFVGHPITVAVVSGVFFAGIVLHGLVIWEDPFERAAALAVAALLAVLVLGILRGPVFRRAVAIEVRDGARGASVDSAFTVLVAGRPHTAAVEFEHGAGTTALQAASGPMSFPGLRRATFTFASAEAAALRVWAHRITPEGDTVGIPAVVNLENGDRQVRQPLDAQGVLGSDLAGGPARVAITFEPD